MHQKLRIFLLFNQGDKYGDNNNNNAKKMLTRTQKLILGVTILIMVDVIWVTSSELTKVFRNQ